jgi:hypothetical protein
MTIQIDTVFLSLEHKTEVLQWCKLNVTEGQWLYDCIVLSNTSTGLLKLFFDKEEDAVHFCLRWK